MDGRTATRIKRLRRDLGLTGAIVALSVGVLLPVLLSTTVGIVALAIGESTKELLVGALVVSFAAAAMGGAVVATVLLGRRARVARMQSDLLANVSHELRTPLAAIRMYAQTLQSGLLDLDPGRTRESLETIVRETEWLEAMVERILAWRALARDRDAVELKAEPVRASVEGAVGRFRRMVAPGEVDLSVEIESERPVAHDAHAIASIVLNLMVNAYKYTGEVKRIRVAVRDVADRQVAGSQVADRVEIFVEDNGIGIPPREVGRIFDPFYRCESGRKGQASGAGLGLAIVRHLVREHGGEIIVESAEGRGSTFTVRLPAATGGAAP